MASSVASWGLWTLPRRALVFVLAVDLAAVALGTVTALSEAPVRGDLLTLALLALGAMVHLEAARHIERLRNHERAAGGAPYIDAKSMWSFAGLVLLTPGPALALVVFTLVWWRFRVSQRPPLYRWVYSASTIVVGSCAAVAILAVGGPNPVEDLAARPAEAVLLVAAALVRWTVNHGLVVTVIGLVSPSAPWRQRLGSLTDNLIGLGALALGIALAVLVQATPWLVPVLLVPVLAMHRGVLLGHFARAARTDPKTGLATIGHWRDHTTREIVRARRRSEPLGVLMVDLDEFKAVNDRHGHVVGDRVLRTVADVLRAEVSDDGAVGRFGGEEFVVLLPRTGPARLAHVAERIRVRIGECEVVLSDRDADQPEARIVGRLTASIGAASCPTTADDLEGLVLAADTALFRAKRDGRDRVRMAERSA